MNFQEAYNNAKIYTIYKEKCFGRKITDGKI